MKATCIHPWADVWINAKGRVTCCPQNSMILGNINNEDFALIWNSYIAQKVRRLIGNKEYKAAGCDMECPFLRGSFTPPLENPPKAELINPELDVGSDATSYSENYNKVFDDYTHRSVIAHGYPLFVDIQSVLRCNSNCKMCGQPHDSNLKHSHIIEEKLQSLRPYANYFRWQGGEVFLLKDFHNYLKNFDARKYPHLRRYVVTNGSMLNEKTLGMLTEGQRPVHFLLSIDGASRETYTKVRKVSHYDKAMKTLNLLASIQKQKQIFDIVRWNYVVMRSTLEDMRSAIDMADELEVNINFAPIQGDFLDENIFRFPNIAGQNLVHYFKELECYSHTRKIKISGFTGMQFRLKNAVALSA